MLKPAPKAPAKKTSPLVWVGLLATCAVAYVMLSPSDAPAPTTAKPKKRTTKDASLFTEADYKAAKSPFAPVTVAAVDAFNPLVKKTIKPVLAGPMVTAGETKGMVPTKFTGGEADWYYTGCPEADGIKQALLENTTTGESVYVKPGQSFRVARIQSVDVSTVVLVGPDGTSSSVPIQAYGDVPGGGKTAVALNAPLGSSGTALNGPIGIGGRIGVQPATGPQTITLSNGQTLQLPPTDGTAPAADNTATAGRRRRRNRNQTSGDPNNGF